jgi:hypothetical protein
MIKCWQDDGNRALRCFPITLLETELFILKILIVEKYVIRYWN